jgi:hypothetical protein
MRPQHRETIRWLLENIGLFALDIPGDERDSVIRFLEGLLCQRERWLYVNVNPEQQEILLDAITRCPRPHQTLRVWAVALKHIEYGTNELMFNHARLAEEAGVTQREVSRSLGYLVEVGACRRIQRGRYKFNPHVIWEGPLVARRAAAQNFTPLGAATKELVDA